MYLFFIWRLDLMIWWGHIHYLGHWKGWALKIETFLSPNGTHFDCCHFWAQKSQNFQGPFFQGPSKWICSHKNHYVPCHMFSTWLGTIRITWGKSPEWLYRNLRFSKRATVGVLATYATRWNPGMKRVKCGWTQPLFHKVSNHWFSGRNLKG